VEYCGNTLQVLVPVDCTTRFVVKLTLNIWIFGGGLAGGATVKIFPPNSWI